MHGSFRLEETVPVPPGTSPFHVRGVIYASIIDSVKTRPTRDHSAHDVKRVLRRDSLLVFEEHEVDVEMGLNHHELTP
jgi:hypothetical protein